MILIIKKKRQRFNMSEIACPSLLYYYNNNYTHVYLDGGPTIEPMVNRPSFKKNQHNIVLRNTVK